MYLSENLPQTSSQSTNESNNNRPRLLCLMDAIIAQNVRETVGETHRDSTRGTALVALEHYLSLPVTKSNEGTYSFWKSYSMTTDRAQKSLCNVARVHLTPPPTSTGEYSYLYHS